MTPEMGQRHFLTIISAIVILIIMSLWSCGKCPETQPSEEKAYEVKK